MKLIYIAYRSVSVFESQVVGLLNYYIESNLVEDVIVILGYDYKQQEDTRNTPNFHHKIKVKFYDQYPQFQLIEKLTVGSIAKAIESIDNVEDYIIHVRNEVLAHYTYKSLKQLGVSTNNMIADVRGAGLEQLIEFSNKNKFILMLKRNQRKNVDHTLDKIKNISVVSASLKEYVKNKTSGRLNIRVVPCLSDATFIFDQDKREQTRRELGVEEDEILLVLSTGGDNKWQNTKEAISYLKNKDVKILNLSRTSVDQDNVITRFVPYSEMNNYLCAADAAIIWRKNSITNRVASPVKFSEYTSCGLPVITNKAVDMITEHIEHNNNGFVLDSIENLDSSIIAELKKKDRNSASLSGRQKFGIENIANLYLDFYKSIII